MGGLRSCKQAEAMLSTNPAPLMPTQNINFPMFPSSMPYFFCSVRAQLRNEPNGLTLSDFPESPKPHFQYGIHQLLVGFVHLDLEIAHKQTERVLCNTRTLPSLQDGFLLYVLKAAFLSSPLENRATSFHPGRCLCPSSP